MKKLLTFLTLLMLFYGVGWAEDKTITIDVNSIGATNSYQIKTATIDGYEFEADKVYKATGDYAGCMQFNKSSSRNARFYNTTAIPGLKSLTINYKTTKSYVVTSGSSSKPTGNSQTGALYSTEGSKTYNFSDGATFFMFEATNTGAFYISSFVVTYDDGGSNPPTPTTYNVICNSAQNGSISVGSTTSYAEGATVTVTATPQTGYKLSTVTVTPSDNEVSAPDVTISGNTATFTMPASNVTVDATFEEKTSIQYKLVEQETDLVSNSEYVLAGLKDGNYDALMGTVSNNLGTAIQGVFTFDSSTKIITIEDGSGVTPLTLVKDNDGYWTIHNGSGYIYHSGDKKIAVGSDITNAAKWIIDEDLLASDNELIQNVGSTNYHLQYNSANPRFTDYSSSQSAVALFKKVETGDYTITIDDAIENGTVTASRESANANDPVTVTVTPEPGYELSTLTVDGTNVTSSVSNNSYTFNMPAHSVTITATFALKKNKVSYTIAPANTGEVWLNNGTTYDQALGYSYSTMGTTVEIALAAYAGYDVNSLTITDEGGATVSYTTYNSEWRDGKWVTYYSFVMPATPVNIAATFKSGDIYILGTVNDNPWNGNKGVKMTYDASTNTYSANVYFATATETGKGQFSFASNLSGNDGDENGNGSWDNIGKRWGAPSQDYDLVTNANGATWTENNSDPNRFAVPYGVYEIKVNWGTGLVTATKKDITVTLDKASGQLETGTTVNVASNLSTLLQSCKSGVSATLAYSTDDGANYTDGNSFVVNSNMTAKGKAYYGKIEAESDAYAYTVVTHYPVTATANPTAGGTVSVNTASALAGETVTITATPKSGYQLESITVNGTAIEPNEGVYSFTMPAQATEVVANFSKIQYTISKVENNCTISITDDRTTAGAGDVVTFTVTPKSNKYYVSTVTLTWDGGQTQTLTATDGTYSFNMQARNVTITATCIRESVGDGSFVLVTDASTLKAGDKVIITNSKTAGSALAMSTTQNNNNRGSASVTITNDIKITPGTDVQVLTLESVDITYNEETFAGWYLNAGNGYLYAASSSSNYLRTGALNANEVGDNAKANIEIEDGGNAFIQFYGNNTRDVIMNNGSIFSCYASTATGMSDVYLFKQSETGLHVEIAPEGGQVIGSQEVTIDANIEGAMVQYKIGDGEWSTPAEGPVTTTITGNVGDNVVVYAKATMDDEGETLEDEINVTFTFVAPTAPTITPASCNISSETQNVTIASNYDNGTIEYSTDGGATWTAYNGQFNVVVEGIGQSVTVQARVTYNGVVSDVAEATYTRGVQPVVFSPANGEYYHNQTCQMFSTTKGARIYYTTDGSEPVMNQGTTQLYTGEIEMTAGNSYNFKAVAYIGTTPSEVTTANYTIKTGDYTGTGNYLYSVADLNDHEVSSSNWTMVNPVQVIYMSTYQQNQSQPEFCLVRDNTGYGMIYFGKQNTHHNNFHVFQMGDWIKGGYSGPIAMATSSQDGQLDTHPELGDSYRNSERIHDWSEELYIGNSKVLPEYITIPEILASETPGNTDYWGHYVHLRKNTVELTSQDKDGKWSGIITDENGDHILYYDKFYLQYGGEYNNWTTESNLFTGHPNRTFDVYGFVACHLLSETHYQISPFDFAWIDKPVIDKETATYYEPQTVTLSSPEDPTATIWYKTDDMDDYAVYTEPFEVNSTTTVSWYATKQSQYNDELESKIGTITMTFEEIAKPVITPDSQVKAVGKSIDASIAFEEGKTVSPIAVILYTTDGSDPKTSETAQEYTIGTTTLHFTTTTTVRAITRVGNLFSAEADAKTYTFVKSNGIEYTLIDNVTKLKENGVYVIVSQNYSEAISTTQNVNNRGAAGVLFVEGTNKAKVYGNDDVAQFTLSVLTHDEDTSPERHFLMQTNNSNVNGYLYVGHDVNNSLMTEAEEDAMGNDVAVITIDADGRAHIHFNYAGGDNRYLQYWNRDRLFNTYKTEYDDRAVYIYGVEATPLATIEKEGVPNGQYTIADELIAVEYRQVGEGNDVYLWCKDQGNVSINKTEIKEGQVDFMKQQEQQVGEWDQSNWVVLKLTGSTALSVADAAKGHFIAPTSVTGHYVDNVNYMIEVTDNQLTVGGTAEYTPNVYSPANFMLSNLNIGDGQGGQTFGDNETRYFFMNPKIQEVCKITFAEWKEPVNENPGYFTVPYTSGFDGAFNVGGWQYNEYNDVSDDLVDESSYFFNAVVNRSNINAYGPKAVEIEHNTTPDGAMIVYPTDLKADGHNVPTEINTVEVGNGEIKSIKYVNVAGIMSDTPFQGVNIVVTEYTDGSRTTSKMLRK